MDVNKKLMFVIADDLTGANDTGVQFASKQLQTEVLLEGISSHCSVEAEVVVVDTNSRALSKHEAYDRVQKITKQAAEVGFCQYYKKVDSTLRGNVGAEIKAILDLGMHDFALVMPAFPKNGRTTVGGYHLLHGVPLSATEIAKDPKCPVFETVLPKLLSQQTDLPVGHIGINELLSGKDSIKKAIQDHLSKGCKIISFDAWWDEHFKQAIEAALEVSKRILWAGSAGLAEYLPPLLGWNQKSNVQLPTFVVAGSVSSVTRGQIEMLLKEGYELVEIPVENYLRFQKQQPMPCIEKALQYLDTGINVVVTSGYHLESVERAKLAGEKLGLTSVEVSDIVSEILGSISEAILREKEVAGIVLTGGDTAVAVCRALGVTGIQVLKEVAPAIPLGKIKTSEGKTLRIVTKAGAFGSPDALLKAVTAFTDKGGE